MDTQSLINLGFSIAGIFGGWILKTVWDEIKLLQSNQRDIERDVHDNYVKRDDFKEALARIEIMFVRIFDKLEDKADK